MILAQLMVGRYTFQGGLGTWRMRAEVSRRSHAANLTGTLIPMWVPQTLPGEYVLVKLTMWVHDRDQAQPDRAGQEARRFLVFREVVIEAHISLEEADSIVRHAVREAVVHEADESLMIAGQRLDPHVPHVSPLAL